MSIGVLKTIRERFFKKVKKTDSCWLWTGKTNYYGYGIFILKPSQMRAHRVSWELHFGDIPDDLVVCHKCDNPKCVNPNHLFIGTHADNVHDKISKGRGTLPPKYLGSNNYAAKLKESDIHVIRELLDSGQSSTTIANSYSVSPSTINNIRHGVTWKVPGCYLDPSFALRSGVNKKRLK